MRRDGRSRHQQIAADLRALIMAGDLSGKLPTTHELMEHYSVGSPTVQRAIQVLKDEGFAEGRRGSGVYAAHRILIDAAAYIPAEGGFSYKLLDVAEVAPPFAVSKAFALEAARTTIMRYRLMSLDGVPVELSWSYYPLTIAAGTADRAQADQGRYGGAARRPRPRTGSVRGDGGGAATHDSRTGAAGTARRRTRAAALQSPVQRARRTGRGDGHGQGWTPV